MISQGGVRNKALRPFLHRRVTRRQCWLSVTSTSHVRLVLISYSFVGPRLVIDL